jgi:hypothetical protein
MMIADEQFSCRPIGIPPLGARKFPEPHPWNKALTYQLLTYIIDTATLSPMLKPKAA